MNITSHNPEQLASAYSVLSDSIERLKGNSRPPHSFDAVLKAFAVVKRVLISGRNPEIKDQLCEYSRNLVTLLPGEREVNPSDLDLANLVQDQFIRVFEKKNLCHPQTPSRFSLCFKLYTSLSYLKDGSPLWDKTTFLNLFHCLSKKDQLALAQCCKEADRKEKIKAQQELSRTLAGMQNNKVKAPIAAASESLSLELVSLENLNGEKLISWVLSELPEGVDAWREAFKVFMDPFLKQKVEKLTDTEKNTLYGHITAIGMSDKLTDGKDKQWGKTYWNQDCQGRSWVWRLARAWDKMGEVEQRQAKDEALKCQKPLLDFYKQCEQFYGKQIAFTLFKHCPYAKTSLLTDEIKNDLKARAEALRSLNSYKQAIAEKYVLLAHTLNDKFKEKELSLLLCPSLEDFQPVAFFAMLSSLVREDHDLRSAELLLDVILKRFYLHPRQELLDGALELRDLKKRGMQQIENQTLQGARESMFKTIFSLQAANSTATIAKYKPNSVALAAREVKGYGYDSILGLSMTPPTGLAKLSMEEALQSLKKSWLQVESKHQLALSDPGLAKIRQAEVKEAYAQAMEQFNRLPEDIRKHLYAYFSIRAVRGNEHYDEGQKAWHDKDLTRYSAESRVLAIGDFLSSERYKNWMKNNQLEVKDGLGSIQAWIKRASSQVNDLSLVDDFLYTDATAGVKLKQMPKVLVHLHCILGLVKGTGDGHPGNTMVRFAPDGASIQSIYEFDDERTLMHNNEHRSFRMWQFGLPQAMQPFDRTTLMLFSDEKLLKQICAYNRSDHKQMVNASSYRAQEERVRRMAQFLQEELGKNEVKLTPQELFFTMLGGKETYTYWTEKMCQSPLEVFEFRMSHFNGKGKHFQTKAIALKNFAALHDLETNAKEQLRLARLERPKAQLVVKFNAGLGNSLFIKKVLPQGGPEDVKPLQYIRDGDIWFLEADARDIGQEMEYKLWHNNQTEEKYPGRRKLEANQFASRFVIPEF
jgi:hypothetical protein